VNLVMATDTKIADSFSNDAKTTLPGKRDTRRWQGLISGPESRNYSQEVIKGSKPIL